MGMIYGFGWLILFFLYTSLFLSLKRSKIGFLKSIIITLLATWPFTYDIFTTNILGAYYCLSAPHPKTLIKKRVEYPISIYWEDNVYPGFSKEDRELMIINYLDGVHLKTMALNGPKNKKVYVYHLNRPLYKEFVKNYLITHPDIHIGNFQVDKAYANEIMKTEQIFTKETMPKTNYTVTFNEIKLNPFARHFLYSDETKVIENNTSKVIAYNRRYMRFFYNMLPDFAGGRYYYYEPMCGERIDMEQRVFESYGWSTIHLGNHSRNLDEILINRYKKGEK